MLSKIKAPLLLLGDSLILISTYLSSYYFVGAFETVSFITNASIAIVVFLLVMFLYGVYNHIIRFSSVREYSICLAASFTSCIVMILIAKIATPYVLSVKHHIVAGVLSSMLFVIFRVAIRQYIGSSGYTIFRNSNKTGAKKVLIIGAGNAGSMVIKDVLKSYYDVYNIVGIIDDDRTKIGCTLCGIKVLGSRKDITSVCVEKRIDLILFCIPSLEGEEKKRILDICYNTGVRIKVLPGINDLIVEKGMVRSLRDMDATDLMPREPVALDDDAINEYISGKVVLVTGGGGSIGSELCRQIAKFSPRHLIVLDIYENNAYDIEYELSTYFPDLEKSIIIASVRDRNRLEEVFEKYRPQIVFHAAAHKHVPLMENNSVEAVKNNVLGTYNVAECADKFSVDKFILISTDKAVNPTNIMGATKRICEMIIQGLNEKSKTEFAAVRFGNVLGSNGSVIPLFKKQISDGGPITVTHKEITRFFMTIPEAAQLVLQAGTYAAGGEIFVLDMGRPVKIYDLAVNMIKLAGLIPGKDIEIKISGLRPGEKLYEELLMSEEGLMSTKNKKIYIAHPMHIDYDKFIIKINKLLKTAINAKDDENLLKSAIRELVPTYRSPDEYNSMQMNENK
ncbi:MAG: polysaccharide biosynthesis protein [Ruminococcaceae bacterium]|nr:polysaccharide biosynthesis protein [Oscillospiraceae bacterium]